jgi:hypothetical protein
MRLEIGERQLLELREEVVTHVVFDVARRADENTPHEKPEVRADDADREEQTAVFQQLAPGHGTREIVNRVLQHAGRGNRDRLRQDDADQAGQKRAAISQTIAKQAPKRRHIRSIARPIQAAGRALMAGFTPG